MPLDSEKDYGIEPLEYKFEIKVPAQAQQQTPAAQTGRLGELVGAALQATNVGMVNWYLKAELDIPLSLGLSKTVEINIA
jgi:hypothetical protein